MFSSKIKKIILFFSAIIILFHQIFSPITISASNKSINDSNRNINDPNNDFFSISLEAQNIFASKKIIPIEELSKDYTLGEGLTIIVGNNISINTIDLISTSNKSKSYIDQQKIQKKLSQDNIVSNELSNIYMILCMKNVDRCDIEYISVTYESSVNSNIIERFINYKTSSESINTYAKDFISDQIINVNSAYNDNKNNQTRAASYTRVVENVRDINYYIANYTTNRGAVYPLMVYKKDISYQAVLVANELENEDLYGILAFVNIIPGNSLSSEEAEKLANTTGLYNSSYSNAIAIKGVRTIFENMFPEYDYYITMAPNNSLSDANGHSITVSVGLPASFSVSYDLDFATASTVTMDTSFDPYDRCTVEFEGTLSWLQNLLYNPCLSTDPFSYTAGVYMCSGSNILYTSVATDILYYFQYPGEDSAIWVGSAKELFYRNTDYIEEEPID